MKYFGVQNIIPDIPLTFIALELTYNIARRMRVESCGTFFTDVSWTIRILHIVTSEVNSADPNDREKH